MAATIRSYYLVLSIDRNTGSNTWIGPRKNHMAVIGLNGSIDQSSFFKALERDPRGSYP